MATFAAMLTETYQRLGYPSSPDTTVTTRLTNYLNEAMNEILAEVGYGESQTLPSSLTFASVASTPTYTMPRALTRIRAITDRTNDVRLERRELQWYRTIEPDPTANTGTPQVWVPLGSTFVSQQPSAAATIVAISTSASDTNSITIEGITSAGWPIIASATMTGTSAKTVTTDLVEVTRCFLSAAAVGTVTLRETSGTGTILTTIPIGFTSGRFLQIALWPTPSDAITYYVDGDREILSLVGDKDEPPFPSRFHRLLIDAVCLREWEKRDDGRYAQVKNRFERDKAKLRAYVWYGGEQGFTMGGASQGVRFSRLGGWAPAEWVK